MTDEEFLDADPKGSLNPLDRAARIALVKEKLQSCLEELDGLGLNTTGAHVSMALHAIETDP